MTVRSDYPGDPPVSEDIEYEVELAADASEERLRALVDEVDRIAEIPNSLRSGTAVRLAAARVGGSRR